MNDNDYVCAPGINFTGGSCITIPILEDMIQTYNKKHISDKINMQTIIQMKELNPVTYKRKMVEFLHEKMRKYKCNSQTCWLTLPIFRALENDKNTNILHSHTFRPPGPRNTNTWLNTLQINEVFEQYEVIYKDFKFFGAQPRDFDKLPWSGLKNINFDKLMQKKIHRLGFVFNLDEHTESGSHWVAMYADLLKCQIYFMDSTGDPPVHEFMELMRRIGKYMLLQNPNCKIDVKCSIKRHQRGKTECGVYAISFILRLLDGETFRDIMGNRISDEEIRLCRKSYFRDEI